MASAALRTWNTTRAQALDRVGRAHAAARREGGREVARLIVDAYTVLLASHFQGFCRDLHDEAADVVTKRLQPQPLEPIVRDLLLAGRQLDLGNARPGAIGADFGRYFVTKFWPEVDLTAPRSPEDRMHLDVLHAWRNAIAHEDYSKLLGARVGLGDVVRWRAACNRLARAIDRTMQSRLHAMVGRRPW